MTGRILHKVVDASHVLKPVGDVRVTQGPILNQFLQHLNQIDILKSVIVDLSDTDCLDSTTLGFLAKIAIATRAQFGFKPTLLFGREDVHRLIASMGFDEIFVILKASNNGDADMAELVADQITEEGLRDQVLDAHKTLMQLNHRNFEAFRDLVCALEAQCSESAQKGLRAQG